MVISTIGADVGDVVGFSTIRGTEVAVVRVEQAEIINAKTLVITNKRLNCLMDIALDYTVQFAPSGVP